MNEDEVEFLDSVLESQRAKENAVRKQTAEEMQAFKQQQEDAEKKAKAAETSQAPEAESTSWAVSRKRKKGKEDVFGGVKLRKASSGEPSSIPKSQAVGDTETSMKKDANAAVKANLVADQKDKVVTNTEPEKGKMSESKAPAAASSAELGLAAYSSDEDD